MKRFFIAALFTLLWCLPALASQVPIELSSDRFVSTQQLAHDADQKMLLAQMNLLTGAGGKFKSSVASSSYVGPGDTFSSSIIAAYSCSEAYTAAYAAAGGNACDLVDSAAPTTVICTLKFIATGRVDLATPYCVGSLTPSAKCAAATGGVCQISKAYNQQNPGTLDVVQATSANQPLLAFNSTPTGTLTSLDCGNGSVNRNLQSSGTFTQAQPWSIWVVAIRNGTFTTAGGWFGSSANNGAAIRVLASTNTWDLNVGGGSPSATAADNAWHAVSGIANGSSSRLNVDGVEGTASGSTFGFSSETLRLCRAGTLQIAGLIAETILWGAGTNPTDRGALNTNARLTNRYTNF